MTMDVSLVCSPESNTRERLAVSIVSSSIAVTSTVVLLIAYIVRTRSRHVYDRSARYTYKKDEVRAKIETSSNNKNMTIKLQARKEYYSVIFWYNGGTFVLTNVSKLFAKAASFSLDDTIVTTTLLTVTATIVLLLPIWIYIAKNVATGLLDGLLANALVTSVLAGILSTYIMGSLLVRFGFGKFYTVMLQTLYRRNISYNTSDSIVDDVMIKQSIRTTLDNTDILYLIDISDGTLPHFAANEGYIETTYKAQGEDSGMKWFIGQIICILGAQSQAEQFDSPYNDNGTEWMRSVCKKVIDAANSNNVSTHVRIFDARNALECQLSKYSINVSNWNGRFPVNMDTDTRLIIFSSLLKVATTRVSYGTYSLAIFPILQAIRTFFEHTTLNGVAVPTYDAISASKVYGVDYSAFPIDVTIYNPEGSASAALTATAGPAKARPASAAGKAAAPPQGPAAPPQGPAAPPQGPAALPAAAFSQGPARGAAGT